MTGLGRHLNSLNRTSAENRADFSAILGPTFADQDFSFFWRFEAEFLQKSTGSRERWSDERQVGDLRAVRGPWAAKERENSSQVGRNSNLGISRAIFVAEFRLANLGHRENTLFCTGAKLAKWT